MKKFLYLLFLLGITCFTATAQLKEVPKPPVSNQLLYDGANVLSPEQEDDLRIKLRLIEDSTSNQLAVAIIPTLDGGSLEDVAVNTYRSWGIGTAKNNNGVLLLVVVNDRKVRIEVGYGLEGVITDALSGDIIRNEIAPYFKQENYNRGIDNAVNAIAKASAGEYKATPKKRGGKGGSIGGLIAIVIIILIVISRGGGSRGGGLMSRRGYGGWTAPFWINTGGWGSSSGGWGGGSSGGSSWGGFGGGSSGGGGASGSW
jgi:uncharacterized protein